LKREWFALITQHYMVERWKNTAETVPMALNKFSCNWH